MTALLGMPARTVEVGNVPLSVCHVDNVLIALRAFALGSTIPIKYFGLYKKEVQIHKLTPEM